MTDIVFHSSRNSQAGQGVFNPPKLAEGCEGCLSHVLEGFSSRFERSARRWELVVYPSLVAFVVLASYGFFLIYSLTADMRTMATGMDPRMGVNMASLSGDMRLIAEGMTKMTENVSAMSVDIKLMRTEIQQMTPHVVGMDDKMDDVSQQMEIMSNRVEALQPIVALMNDMNRSVWFMTGSVSRMGRDMDVMSRPMGFMSTFLPMNPR